MRAKLLQLITRNWPIKVAALFLSLMLYVAVQLQQPVTDDFEVALSLELPPGRTLQQKLPKVRAQISGQGSQVLKLRTLRGDLSRRVPDTLSTATWTFRLEPSEVQALLGPSGADVRVLDIRPREITIALDSVAQKEVRIVPRLTVTPDSNQVLQGGISLSPTVARLVGAEKSLAAIESVTTLPTEITGVPGGGPFERTVAIDTAPLGLIRVVPKQVTIGGAMVMLAERSFTVPVETGAGAATSFIVTPARVAVRVRGPEDRVAALTADSLRVVAVARGDGAARITVIAPRGITARATPDSVTLRRRTRPRG